MISVTYIYIEILIEVCESIDYNKKTGEKKIK